VKKRRYCILKDNENKKIILFSFPVEMKGFLFTKNEVKNKEKKEEKENTFPVHIILYTKIRRATPFYFYWKLFLPISQCQRSVLLYYVISMSLHLLSLYNFQNGMINSFQ